MSIEQVKFCLWSLAARVNCDSVLNGWRQEALALSGGRPSPVSRRPITIPSVRVLRHNRVSINSRSSHPTRVTENIHQGFVFPGHTRIPRH